MKAEVGMLKLFLEIASEEVIEEICYLLTQNPNLEEEEEQNNFQAVYNQLQKIIEL